MEKETYDFLPRNLPRKLKMKKKISLISDFRGSHSLYIPVLDAISKSTDFEYQYIITGMHLSEKFGRTIEEIKTQGYTITRTFPLSVESTRASQVKNIADSIQHLTTIFMKDRPDFILAQGDRGITLAVAIVGNHLRIPVVHMHGGEISRTVDEPVRHAISRFAHIHVAASNNSAERLRKMGEEEFRIQVVGATGVEYIKKLKIKRDAAILHKYNLSPDEPFIVVLQHPVSGEEEQAGIQIKKTLHAMASLNLKTLIIYPNSDPGYEEMIKIIEDYGQKYPRQFLIYKNVPYFDYLHLLKASCCLIGNSSGGIIETPSLGTPTINVGTRQWGRERAQNVIDVDYNEEDIKKALECALHDVLFKHRVAQEQTPYDPHGDGNASGWILKVMREIKVDDALLTKRLAY